MMLRMTKKAMNKGRINEYDLEPINQESIPLSEWYVNHFKLNRKEYFILTEAKSLYSIIEPSVGISNIELFKKRVITVMRKFEIDKKIDINSIDTEEIVILKTINRSIVGSQVDLIRMAEEIFYYDDENYDEFERINETPLMYTKSCPKISIIDEIRKIKSF